MTKESCVWAQYLTTKAELSERSMFEKLPQLF
jgi:hypothetical protein